MTSTKIVVTGMNCQHCVEAVSGELKKLGGVRDVAVDLATGHVTIESERALDADAIRDAVDEAGYEVVR